MADAPLVSTNETPIDVSTSTTNETPSTPPGVPVFDISGQEAIPGTLHPDEVTEAVASGKFSLPKGEHVQVVDPDGQLGTLDPAEAPEAFQNGYKYATQADLDKAEFSTPVEQAKTIGQGLLKGIAGPVGTAVMRGMGADPERMRKRDEVNPGLATGSQIAGFVAPALASLGTSALARASVAGAEAVLPAMQAAESFSQAGLVNQAGEAAARALGMGGEASTIAGKLATSGVKMGAEMGLFQAGDEATKALQQDPNQTAQTAATDIGMSALFGGALGVGTSGVGQLWKASGAGEKLGSALGMIKNDANGIPQTGEGMNPLAAKALSVASGVPESDLKAYYANREAINAVPEFEDIHEHALKHVEGINEAVASSRVDKADAEIAYKNLEADLNQEYKQRGYDAKEAAKAAKQDYNEAQKSLISKIQQNALDKAEPISQAVETLRQQVIDGSGKAYDVLEASPHSVPLDNFYNKGVELMKELNNKGTLESKAQAERLGQYLSGIKADVGTVAAGPRAKALIQGLDGVSKYDYNATAFDKGMSNSYKQLRHTLDSDLKLTVPEYRQAMMPVAEKTSLLSKLNKYGEEAKATSAIKNLGTPVNYRNEMPLLRALEGHTGAGFAQDLEKYANPELQAKLARSVPEYKAHVNAAKIEAAMKDPKTLQAMNDALTSSKEHQALMKARAAAEEAKLAKESIAGVTPNNLESKLLNAGRGKLDQINTLEKFPELNGQSLPELLKLSKVKEAFGKTATNGSRNVNMYGGILGGIGGLMHSIGGLAGVSLGAGMGGAVDKYGPAMAKRIMDAYLNRFGDVAKLVGKPEAVSAVRAALARMIDNDAALTTAGGKTDLGAHPNLQGFKSAVDFIDASLKGDKLVKTATKNLFKAEADILPKSQHPSPQDLARLKKNLKLTWEKEEGTQIVDHMNKTIGPVAHYMPEHGTALTYTMTNVSNYLKSLEPKATKLGMLDALSPITAQAKSEYERTLGIAQQPLMVIDHIKKGTLTPKDMQDFKVMFPSLYAKLSQELTNSMIEHSSKAGAMVPYKTRLGISLFLGQPVDSTLTGPSIMSAQPRPQQPEQQPSSKPSQANGISKLPKSYQTPSQAREQENQDKK